MKALALGARIAGLALALLHTTLSIPVAGGQTTQWPNWRGPEGNGVSPDGNPPIHWSETENVLFKVEVPGNGLSSPIVWKDRIYVTTSIAEDAQAYARAEEAAQKIMDAGEWPPAVTPVKQSFRVLALSSDTGEVVWQRTAAERVPHESHYLDSSWSNASPITDGERLYIHFGSNGTYAYALDGTLLWQVDLGDMTTRRGHGEGSTPTLYGDLLIVNWDHEGDSFLVALDKRTGQERWRTARPEEVTSWSTPVVLEATEGPQIVISATGASRGYDLTGQELWRLSGMTFNAIPTPVHRAGIVYLASGYRGSMLQAVQLDQARATGSDLAGSAAVRWTRERDTPYVPSPLLYDEQIYFLKHNGNILTSLDADSGEALFTARLAAIHNVYASPLGAADRIYVFGRDGETVVLKHGPKLEVLATNELDDGIDATPAIVGDTLYVRGRHHLYALRRAR